jgi:hypothetical protein
MADKRKFIIGFVIVLPRRGTWGQSPALEGNVTRTDAEEIAFWRNELRDATMAYEKAESQVKAAQEAYIGILERSLPVEKRPRSPGPSRLDEPGRKRARTSLNAQDRGKARMQEADKGVPMSDQGSEV